VIRSATPDDAEVVGRLIWESNGGIASLLSGSDDQAESLAFYRWAFTQPGNRLSFENALVLEEDERVVGALLAYHGRDSGGLNRPLAERLSARRGHAVEVAPEARQDEFYLDSLGVDADLRGRGLGRRLLAAFEERAGALGHVRLGLLTEPDNRPAFRLYESVGFRPDGLVRVGPYLLEHMSKHLPGQF
jgi:ribosomal protein S18 acetylase RimI-like enzyme